MEQDRASNVLSHHPQLARPSLGQPRSRRQPDWQHDPPEGLRIQAQLDERDYRAGIQVSDEEIAERTLERDEFQGEWNYWPSLVTEMLERVLFKLFLLGSLASHRQNENCW